MDPPTYPFEETSFMDGPNATYFDQKKSLIIAIKKGYISEIFTIFIKCWMDKSLLPSKLFASNKR